MKTDNEIIAEFMGGKWETVWCGGQETKAFNFPKWHITDWPHQIHEDTFSYDKSWDWLMPVVEKINKLNDSDQLKGLDYDLYRSMQDWIISVEIKSAYADAVSIIKWYNENNK